MRMYCGHALVALTVCGLQIAMMESICVCQCACASAELVVSLRGVVFRRQAECDLLYLLSASGHARHASPIRTLCLFLPRVQSFLAKGDLFAFGLRPSSLKRVPASSRDKSDYLLSASSHAPATIEYMEFTFGHWRSASWDQLFF